ncbi:MAG: hypothetical protein ACRC41_12890, partial [Sarcina sp.]
MAITLLGNVDPNGPTDQHHDGHVLVMSVLCKNFDYIRMVRGLKNDIVHNNQMILIRGKQFFIIKRRRQAFNKLNLFILPLQFIIQRLKLCKNQYNVIRQYIHHMITVFQNRLYKISL